MGNEFNCDRCDKHFKVKPHVALTLTRFGKEAFCPFCGKNDKTNKIGQVRSKLRKPVGSISDPPSDGQLSYIKSLGGNPGTVKTKGDAGVYIAALKKLKKNG